MAGRVPCFDDSLDLTFLLLRRTLLRSAAPLLVGLLPGCDGSEIPSFSGRPHCEMGVWRPLSNMQLAQDVAYISRRSRGASGLVIEEESGALCQGATDRALCEAEVERVSREETAIEDGLAFYLTTDGDRVEWFQSFQQILGLIGTIDTADEALLVADAEGYAFTCDSKVGRQGSGYGVVLEYGICDGGAPGTARTYVRVSADGQVSFVTREEERKRNKTRCESFPGRRPPGLLAARRSAEPRTALARYFARAARLEAASVEAFAILERELVSQGLPQTLRAGLRRAADDEARHAHDTGRLAERYGARAERAELRRSRTRSLGEIALDNAVEGCVGETQAAYVAHVQARQAREPELRRVLTAIAEEETRHAALSFQLASWLEPRLDAATRERVGRARQQAMAGLVA